MGIASTSFIWSFLVATLLGFLIGLEREGKRESTGTIFAGVRTFPLIAVFGAVSGQISTLTSNLLLFASLAAMALLIGLAYWRESAGHKLGGTTGVAALVAYGLGVLAGLEQYVAALAGAVITTGLLSLRQELRTLIGALTREDLLAVVKFAAVSLVILPLVPDASLGPWGVWNPRTIWWLVVLISGISFIGYVAVKWIGPRRGMGLSGLLGGLASSTAVTLSFSRLSRLSRDQPALGNVVAVGVIAASALLQCVTGALAAFAFARMRFPGRDLLFTLFLATLMIPGTVTLTSSFLILARFNWIDTYAALIVPHAASGFAIFLLRQFFMTIPTELEEAAHLDGAGRLRFLWSIVLPLSRPALTTVFVFIFISTYNAFLWPLVVTSSERLRVIQIALSIFSDSIDGGSTAGGQLLAASVLTMLPTIILFMIFQNAFIRGITRTGLK